MNTPSKRMVSCLMLLGVALGSALAGVPEGWETSGLTPGDEIGVDRAVARTGKASAVIKSTDPDPNHERTLEQWVRAENYRGKRIRLSAFVKTKGVGTVEPAGVGLWITVVGETERLGLAIMKGHRVKGTSDWASYEQVIDIPQGAALLYFGVGLHGPGEVWVDDVKLERIEKQGSTNERKLTEPRPEYDAELRRSVQRRLRTSPPAPVNLDFEQTAPEGEQRS
jgi:hypothetical protein